jgi:hypothetical protein
MASLNPSFYPIATGARFSLLDLPTELLIEIATQVISVSQKHDFTLFGRNTGALVSLSCVNRELRDICFAVGLFLTVEPTLQHKQLKPSLLIGGPVYCQPRTANVKTLVVDVSQKELWPMYWQVLALFPRIEELRFVQRICPPTDRVWSEYIISSIESFRGKSLVFSGWEMSANCPRVDTMLSNIRREAITSVFIDRSVLFFETYRTSRRPLFPNLRRVKYSGGKWSRAENYDSPRRLMPLMKGTTMTHFEICYKDFPYCCFSGLNPRSDSFSTMFPVVSSRIREAVSQVSNSLRVYIDSNTLATGTYEHAIGADTPNPFTALRLVVYKCQSLGWLDKARCPLADIRCRPKRNLSRYLHHCPWLHLSSECKFFAPCDTILIHSESSFLVTSLFDWRRCWDFAVSNLARCPPHGPHLRYILAGNDELGYKGIMVETVSSATMYDEVEERTVEYWSSYQELEPKVCRQLISERLKGL